MSQIINLDQVQVQVISDSSGIFWGNNRQINWKSVVKQNLGCGVVSGDSNQLPMSLNNVLDEDVFDSMVTAAFPAPAGKNLQSVVQNRQHDL